MSVTIGTPLQSSAYKVLLLGSGELGKEVVISCNVLESKFMLLTVMIMPLPCRLRIIPIP